MSDELVMVLARNRPRVLASIATLMAHRLVEVHAMTVACDAETDAMSIALTIGTGTPGGSSLLQKRLNRLVDVVKVVVLTDEAAHRRTGVLIKVATDTSERSAILGIVQAFGAEVVEVSPTTLTIALQSTPANVASLHQVLATHRVLEVVSLGDTAIARGSRVVHRNRSTQTVVA